MARPVSMFYWKARGCFATDAGGKRTVLVKGPKTNPNREIAVQKLALLIGSRVANSQPTGPITVAELIDRFLADCEARVAIGELKPNTLNLFYRPYCELLRAGCGAWLAHDVDHGKIVAYRAQLARRSLAHNTIKNHLGVLRTMLRWAERQELIAPRRNCPIPCLARTRREKIPTAAELEKLLAAAAPDVCDVLTTILHIAVRPGDCYALRRGWVDLPANLLRLPDSKTGQRLVCLVPVVAEIIQRRLSLARNSDDFVFTTVTGRPWTIRHFAATVRTARNAAGLGPHVTGYTLRHAWTTQAFLNGVPLQTVRALRGDRDIRTTLIYEHLANHSGFLQKAARQAIGLPAEAG